MIYWRDYITEYRSWQGMKNRCYNKKSLDYKDYGGRGVVVCERWVNSFENFIEDMGRKPSAEHSIDRFPITQGNYTPANCRWATKKEQSRNRSYCKIYLYKGKPTYLEDLALELKTYPSNIKRMMDYRGVGIKEVIAYYEERNRICGDDIQKRKKIKSL